jgi:hypothetical protein
MYTVSKPDKGTSRGMKEKEGNEAGGKGLQHRKSVIIIIP